jgi:hypothetical protein
MSKKIIIGIILAVLMATSYLIYSSIVKAPEKIPNVQNDNTIATSSKVTSSPSKNTTGIGTNTFKSIFNQTGSHECDYELVTYSSKTSATIYIADGKMRAEFRTLGNNPTSNMMVYNGGILYVWTEGMGVGTKSQLNSVSELPFIIPKDLSSGYILNSATSSVSWNCHDWSKNNTLLAPPSTVKFK